MKKSEREKAKQDFINEIEKVKVNIFDSSTDNGNDVEISDLLNTLSSLEEKYNTVLDYETAGQTVHSRMKWAEHGEKSSKYFCNLEKRSNEKKNIHLLRNEDEFFFSDQKDILTHLQSFYRTLYSSHSNVDLIKWLNFLDQIQFTKLSEDSKTDLNKPVNRSEILTSLKDFKV